MNSSALPCGDMGRSEQPLGKSSSGSELSPPVDMPFTLTVALMWRSVMTTRPHFCSSGTVVGVANVMYCVDLMLSSFGFIGT